MKNASYLVFLVKNEQNVKFFLEKTLKHLTFCGGIIELSKRDLTLNFLKRRRKMKDSNVRRKSFLIICNILLALLLLVTTAVTITLAVSKFSMNIGGNISFQSTDVRVSVSQGSIANGTVAR